MLINRKKDSGRKNLGSIGLDGVTKTLGFSMLKLKRGTEETRFGDLNPAMVIGAQIQRLLVLKLGSISWTSSHHVTLTIQKHYLRA